MKNLVRNTPNPQKKVSLSLSYPKRRRASQRVRLGFFRRSIKRNCINLAEEMIAEVRKLDKERVYIFLNNLSHEATEEDIRMFYKDHKISKIFPKQKLSGAFDVQFDSKEDAIKFLEAGTGVYYLCVLLIYLLLENTRKAVLRKHK